jgi:ElaA protein
MTQLTLALDRDSGLVMEAFDERDAAVKRMLHLAIQACRKAASTWASAARARATTRSRRVADVRRHRIDVSQSGHRGRNLAALAKSAAVASQVRAIGILGAMLTWRFAPFDKLAAREVHDLFQARVGVFMLEQKCLFQDVDGLDPDCWHLIGRDDGPSWPTAASSRRASSTRSRRSAACSRPPRGARTGAGRALMREAVARTNALWPGRDIRIGAQRYLERFYGDFGFVTASEPYDEDGIMHVEMVRAAMEKQNV